MPILIEGSCHCGSVRFTFESHTPYPYQLCYCSICRKTAGGGGYAINIMGNYGSLKIRGTKSIAVYRAKIVGSGGRCRTSSGERSFCLKCATALWMYDPHWPDLFHPFASAIDIELPVPPSRVHLMLRYKPNWVVPKFRHGDAKYDEYPELSIEQWHRRRDLWID
jgi:hypothetical protein